MKKINFLNCLLLFPVFYLLIITGCATARINSNILAVVDGEAISGGDLEYALQVAHRREDLSFAKTLDIEEYIEKLINDRLLVHEAERMGMDKYPGVNNKVQAYLLRESVVKLYDEEVVGKVYVTEEDIYKYYKDNYEQFRLNVIETDREEEAEEILKKLQGGEAFESFSRKQPQNMTTEEEGFLFIGKALSPDMKETVLNLKPGEFSNVIKSGHKFYIIKFLNRQDAPEEQYEQEKKGIESTIKKTKIDKRGYEYLQQLRKEAGLKIDQALLESVKLNRDEKKHEDWVQDERTLVEINGEVLTVGRFVQMLPSESANAEEKVLNNWIERKLVDHEALKRDYEINTDLKEMLGRYKNYVLKDTFNKEIIAPRVKISDSEVKEYYESHQSDYAKPYRYKIQKITVESKEEAEELLNELESGASFTWLAKTKSNEYLASEGGSAEWVSRGQLERTIGEILDTLKPGEISPVIESGNAFIIVRLQEKSGQEFEAFEKVRNLAFKSVFKKHFNDIYDEYINELRSQARIKINHSAVQSFKKVFKE